MTKLTPDSTDRDLRLVLLCIFAVFNPLVVQASFFFAPSFRPGGLSVPQVFQGAAFLVGIAIVLWTRWTPTVDTVRLGRFMALVAVGGTIFLGKSILESGGLSSIMSFRGDFVVYFKMVFWSSSWFLVAVLVQTQKDAARLLRAIALGAWLTSLIVVVCYLTGAGAIATYAIEGARASIGASGVSVKQTVPYLASCAFVAMYLGRRERWLVGLAAALTLIAATLISYDRAVQVGLVVAALWFFVWRFFLVHRRKSHTSERVFIVCGLLAVALFGSLGYESLHARWTSDFAKNRPGSGRLGFYQAAAERFSEGPAADMLFGVGYSGIRQTMEERCGMSVHTHSDFFDLMLGGGLLGLGIYGAFFWTLFRFFRGVPLQSAECALMGAVGAVYVVMGLITGLLEATHAMFCLGAIFQCCHVIATSTPATGCTPDEKPVSLGN